MTPDDIDQVKDMIQGSVTAAIAALGKQGVPPRSYAEVGSPEFAEDRTQINSLNNKFVFATELMNLGQGWTRSQSHFDDLQSRGLTSYDALLQLQEKVNQKFFTEVEDGRRIRDGWNYNTAYDLANPVAVGSGANITAGSIPSNRAIDAATAQSVLNNTTMQTAIEAAVANALNGTIPTLEAAIGAAVAAALANVPNNAAGNKPAATPAA